MIVEQGFLLPSTRFTSMLGSNMTDGKLTSAQATFPSFFIMATPTSLLEDAKALESLLQLSPKVDPTIQPYRSIRYISQTLVELATQLKKLHEAQEEADVLLEAREKEMEAKLESYASDFQKQFQKMKHSFDRTIKDLTRTLYVPDHHIYLFNPAHRFNSTGELNALRHNYKACIRNSHVTGKNERLEPLRNVKTNANIPNLPLTYQGIMSLDGEFNSSLRIACPVINIFPLANLVNQCLQDLGLGGGSHSLNLREQRHSLARAMGVQEIVETNKI